MLTIKHRNGATVIRLQHGPVNTLDLDLLRALPGAVARAPGPLVITGAGRAFSAGLDLRRILEEQDGYTAAVLAALCDALLAVFEHPAPTVAAVNGHAIAGGCVLALACDARLMSAGQIGLTELALGVPFPAAALQIARHALGAMASRVILHADTVEPADGVRLGLIDQIVPAGQLLDRAITLAAAMAAGDGHAYALAKRQLHQTVTAYAATVSDEDIIRAWTSPATRDRLATHLARLRCRDRPDLQTCDGGTPAGHHLGKQAPWASG